MSRTITFRRPLLVARIPHFFSRSR
jgi:hypothetical protein